MCVCVTHCLNCVCDGVNECVYVSNSVCVCVCVCACAHALEGRWDLFKHRCNLFCMTVFSVCMCACAHRFMRVSVSQCVGCSALSVDLCLVLWQSERMRAAFLILPNTGMGFSLEANPDTLWFVVDRCGWWLWRSDVRCPAHRDAASRVPGKTETATRLQGLLLGIDSYCLCNVCLPGSRSHSSSNIIYEMTCWKREKGNSLLFSL